MSFISRPNSWVAQDAASTTKLSYGLQLNPAPFTVSIPQEDPLLGSLEFVVTNPTGNPLSINSVAFTMQVGTASDCLTPTTTGILTVVSDTTNWTVTGPPSPVTSGPATYTLGPKTGTSVTLAAGASVVVQIYQIQTVTVPGNATITVKEMVASVPAFTSFLVTTFPSGFYFNGLAASVLSGSSLTPVAQVNTGSTVTLTWNSSVVDVSAFVIYYSNASQGQQTATPSDIGEWTSPPVTSDTVFTVVVTTSVLGGQPLTASISTSVSVRNPSLVAASINVGQATVTGSMSVSGPLTANGVTATGVTVTGPLSANSAAVSGALSANTVSASGATISGTVSANTVTANSASVGGVLSAGGVSVGGGLSVNNINTTGGYVVLCPAPDYTQACVSIGGTTYNNVKLMVTNNQGTGHGIYVNAPNLSGGWWALDVHGQCINTSGSWSQLSDIRLKERIESFRDGLAQVLKINPIRYHYKEETGLGSKDAHVGVAAQELEKIASYMVGKTRLSPDSDQEYLSMDSGAMIYLLINAVKELHGEIDELKRKLPER